MVESDWDEDDNYPPNNRRPELNRRFVEEETSTENDRHHENRHRNSNDDRVGVIEKTIFVDSQYTGRIIGKSGCKIKELQSESNTKISVYNMISDPSKTTVLIKGYSEDVNNAISMIQKLTVERNRITFETSSQPIQRNARQHIDWTLLAANSEIRNREKFGDLPEIIKCFYEEPEHIRRLTDEEVVEIRLKKNKISVQDMSSNLNRRMPNPVLAFTDIFGEFPEIMSTVNRAGFKEPSPIQSQAWPVIMSGHDLIGIAQTGTGKTLCFLLPALVHIDSQVTPRSERNGPTCLILSPTRELAQQIHQEVERFSYRNIRSVCIYGGGDRRTQVDAVSEGVEIVIATPGRLNDLIKNKIISLKDVTYLVLDEADRMLDLGFEPEIRKVLFDVRPDRQTIMTSATWPPGVSRLIKSYMNDPMQINVGSLSLTACRNVEQLVDFVEPGDKFDRIKAFIQEMPPDSKLLVFVARKITADHLTSELVLNEVCGGEIQCIHGNREQVDREQALSEFKSGQVKVLIATDVASRGLDICDINYVINYDFPKNIEEYVHRIGRTGRADKFGISLSFMSRENWGSAQDLVNILTESKQYVPDELVLMAERFADKRRQNENERLSFPDRGNQYINPRAQARSGGVRLCRTCGKPGHLSAQCNDKRVY